MEEEWLPVPGYEGVYEVSDKGRVRSLDRVATNGRQYRGEILSSLTKPYRCVSLSWGGLSRRVYVHHLVAEVFLGARPADRPWVKHKNGIKWDCSKENLEYGTPVENAMDTLTHGHNRNANKADCTQGHALSEPNLILSRLADGHRACLTCARARVEYRYHKGARGTLEETMNRHYEKVMENA